MSTDNTIPASAPAATSTIVNTAVKKVVPAASTQAVKEAAPVKKVTATTVKTTVKTTTTGVRWATSGLNAIGSLASFDYSTSIRNAYKKKVEAYAKRNGITLITASVVNSMHQ
jgi:galactitol-specific phosphotransferase system IIB component